ncbi:MAG: NfeD family protein [Pirellulales bacterium]|nr:NfeD family protein [Pirellulales bacterium]
MTTIFLVCAALGGTILVLQFVMALIGFGAHAFDLDVPGHLDGDVGGDAHFGGDFHADSDFHGHADGHTDTDHADSTWLFKVVSFRTVVAALAFFGLAGLASESAGIAKTPTMVIAVASGLAAMFAVYGVMRALMLLHAEGTAHITNAIGRVGTVYTTIPAEGAGVGKIQLNLQGRTMEYLALTPGNSLKPGTKVVVGAVISADTLEVEPALEENHEPQ